MEYNVCYSVLQTQFEIMMALDSCTVIEILKDGKFANKVIRLFKGNHSRIVLQDIVLKEVQKILRMPQEQIIEKIGLRLNKEVFVFVTSEQMRTDAKEIERKYGICHYPDSIIFTASKMYSWSIITLDRNMITTARCEGILAFNPIRLGAF